MHLALSRSFEAFSIACQKKVKAKFGTSFHKNLIVSFPVFRYKFLSDHMITFDIDFMSFVFELIAFSLVIIMLQLNKGPDLRPKDVIKGKLLL